MLILVTVTRTFRDTLAKMPSNRVWGSFVAIMQGFVTHGVRTFSEGPREVKLEPRQHFCFVVGDASTAAAIFSQRESAATQKLFMKQPTPCVSCTSHAPPPSSTHTHIIGKDNPCSR